jgi:uncharacterized protein (TIGR00269 family)
MKCRKCNKKAVFNMRQHKLALCSHHFLEWVPEQTQRFIEKYHMFSSDDPILVAVSGGKDSLSLWDVLIKLGYHADGLYIGLGINNGTSYSALSQQKAEAFAADRGLKLIITDVREVEGASIPEAAKWTSRGRQKPCSVCGITKRHFMNRIALEGGYQVLATGHNLDDEAAILFGNTLNWQLGYLSRQNPVLEGNPEGFVQKVKPFFRFYERETAAYAFLRGIDYIHDECPYAEGANSIYYKGVLNEMEAERPGIKLQFYLSFLKAKEAGAFSEVDESDTLEMHKCEKCGQLTTAPGQCVYCRTWGKIRTLHEEAN